MMIFVSYSHLDNRWFDKDSDARPDPVVGTCAATRRGEDLV